MYCSKRNCYNEIISEQDGFQLCELHYNEMKEKLKESDIHTVENCFCGNDHTKTTKQKRKELEK